MTGVLTPFARRVLSFRHLPCAGALACPPSVCPCYCLRRPCCCRPASAPRPQVKGTGHCDASQLGWAIGQPANEPNIRRLSSESGAGLVNPIGPSTITTKDIRQDRLRVYVDKDNIITATRCE